MIEMKYYASFRVSLPSGPDEVRNGEAHNDVMDAIGIALGRLANKYPDLTVDHSTHWGTDWIGMTPDIGGDNG